MTAFFSYGSLGRGLVLVILQLPFGILVGAATERFSRRCSHVHARLRNIIAKLTIALASVSLILGHRIPLLWHALGSPPSHDHDTPPEKISVGMFLSLVTRIFAFAAGTAIGAVLQPVGLTGGIATGKSTVSSLFQSTPKNGENEKEVEFVIIDVDGIAHDILLPKTMTQYESVYDRLVSEFGTDILVKDEGKNNAQHASCSPSIDRRKLGDIVFPDKKKRRKLNSITHPTIIKIMLKRIIFEGLNLSRFYTSKPEGTLRVVCVDIPLLFEGGLGFLFGTIIVVACKPTVQLERLRKRNPDLTLEQCRQRIASQIPVDEKARKAHVVIRNDESLKSLKKHVREVQRLVANAVSGPQRGIELPWLVLGFGLLLLK